MIQRSLYWQCFGGNKAFVFNAAKWWQSAAINPLYWRVWILEKLTATTFIRFICKSSSNSQLICHLFKRQRSVCPSLTTWRGRTRRVGPDSGEGSLCSPSSPGCPLYCPLLCVSSQEPLDLKIIIWWSNGIQRSSDEFMLFWQLIILSAVFYHLKNTVITTFSFWKKDQ